MLGPLAAFSPCMLEASTRGGETQHRRCRYRRRVKTTVGGEKHPRAHRVRRGAVASPEQSERLAARRGASVDRYASRGQAPRAVAYSASAKGLVWQAVCGCPAPARRAFVPRRGMGRLIPGVVICGPASHYRRLGARARRFRPAYSPHVTRYTALSLAHRRSTAAQAGRKACLLSSRGGARLCFLRSMPSLRGGSAGGRHRPA